MISELEEYRQKNADLIQELQRVTSTMQSKEIKCFSELAVTDKNLAAEYVGMAKKVPPMIMRDDVNIGLFGIISSGKSTMLNSLLGKKVAATGAGGTTKSLANYSGSGFTLWDVPGGNDGIYYMSATYTAFWKSLTKLLILITATIQEMMFVFKLLDALDLKYVIVVNKIDTINDEGELETFKSKINEEIYNQALIGVEKVFFVSGRYPSEQGDWQYLVRHVLGESTPIFYAPKIDDTISNLGR